MPPYRIYNNTAPPSQITKSLHKYYRDFLAGKVDPGIKCHFELVDGTIIDQPVRNPKTVANPKRRKKRRLV